MDRRELLQSLGAGTLAAATGCSQRRTATSAEDLVRLDCISQADLVVGGMLTATDLVTAAIKRKEALNPRLNALTFSDIERALNAASNAEGPLAGVPYLIKDLNAYKGMPLTRGSRLFADTVADSQTAFTDRIDAAGVIVLGKTNTPEFGLLPSTEPLLHGATRNPWNLEHTPGGSSGGAAAAVAARLVPAAQASDGGGSIRIPASQCGLVGLKPTAGRFPDQGHGGQAWPISIKHALTLSVRDSALLLALTERTDGGPLLPVGFVEREKNRPMNIAFSVSAAIGQPQPDVIEAINKSATVLTELGHNIVAVEQTPLMDEQFNQDFLVLWASGAYAAAALVTEKTGMPAEQTGLLEPATTSLAAMFASLPRDALPDALSRLAAYQQRVIAFLGEYDAWLTPVTASAPPPIGHLAPDIDFETLTARVSAFAPYTPVHNVTGTPAISIPAGRNDAGLPIGVQLAAGLGQEARLLQLAYQLEQATPWFDQLPPVHA